MTEGDLHRNICDYLKLQYPSVFFRTDFAAGIKMTVGQARRHKSLQSGRAWPDLFIAEPRGVFHGLFLELKKEGTRVFLKTGELSTDAHIREQYAVLLELGQRGYAAEFAIGFEMTRKLIDQYLSS